jgi:hypothetical protein
MPSGKRGHQPPLPVVPMATVGEPSAGTAAADSIRMLLSRPGSPKGFHEEALALLFIYRDELFEELGSKAIQEARRRRAEAIENRDVDRALDKVRRRESDVPGLWAWLFALGGILLGIAATGAVAVEFAPGSISHVSRWWMAIIGCSAIAIVLLLLVAMKGLRTGR